MMILAIALGICLGGFGIGACAILIAIAISIFKD